VYFLHVFSFANLESTMALYMCVRFRFAEKQIGYLFAYIGIIAAVVQGGLIGRLVRRFGEVRLLRTGFIFVATGMVSLALLRGPLDWGAVSSAANALGARCSA